MRFALALVVVCGCGRIGFTAREDDQPPGDARPDAGPGPLKVTVTGSHIDANAGEPIDGAYVVFVAADGAREVVRTDASGVANTFVTGATTVHVAYLATPEAFSVGVSAVRWRVMSYEEIGGGTELMVGAPTGFGGAGDVITVNLPVLTQATEYLVIGPSRCGIDGTSSMPSFTQSFGGRCDGATVRLYAVARTPTSSSWLDVGDVTLAPGAVISPTATWQPTAPQRIQIDGIPDGVVANAGLVHVLGPDDALEIGYDEVAAVGGTAVLAFDGPTVSVEQLRAMVGTLPETSVQLVRTVAPPEVAGTRSLDPALFSTAFESLTVDPESAAMTWTYGPPTQHPGVVVATVELFVTPADEEVEWFYYHPVATTSSLPPELPAPLDTLWPAPATSIEAGVILFDLGGGDYAEVVARIDRDLSPYVIFPNELPLGAAVSLRFSPGAVARVAPSLRGWIERAREALTAGG